MQQLLYLRYVSGLEKTTGFANPTAKLSQHINFLHCALKQCDLLAIATLIRKAFTTDVTAV